MDSSSKSLSRIALLAKNRIDREQQKADYLARNSDQFADYTPEQIKAFPPKMFEGESTDPLLWFNNLADLTFGPHDHWGILHRPFIKEAAWKIRDRCERGDPDFAARVCSAKYDLLEKANNHDLGHTLSDYFFDKIERQDRKAPMDQKPKPKTRALPYLCPVSLEKIIWDYSFAKMMSKAGLTPWIRTQGLRGRLARTKQGGHCRVDRLGNLLRNPKPREGRKIYWIAKGEAIAIAQERNPKARPVQTSR